LKKAFDRHRIEMASSNQINYGKQMATAAPGNGAAADEPQAATPAAPSR
jgi:hypothetical protein